MLTRQQNWSPTIEESLACRKDYRKEAKEHDENAVGTYLEAENKLVAHVLMDLSLIIFTFLEARNEYKVQFKVTESRDWKTDLLSLDPSWPERQAGWLLQNSKKRTFL